MHLETRVLITGKDMTPPNAFVLTPFMQPVIDTRLGMVSR